ncbi:hypothetical protein YQE_06926, partial [Dendroctonus ponderosae]
MEDLLLNIVKEANGSKLCHLKQKAQEAHDLLASQNNLLRNPSFELRSVCFIPLKLALESKRSKLVSLALTGLNKIIRDERFQSGTEPEDDSLWLPAQLLLATSSMLAHCEDTQVHILRVVLNLACTASWALNGRLVMLLLSRCGDAYELGTQPVRAAAQAAASQTLTAFCTFLGKDTELLDYRVNIGIQVVRLVGRERPLRPVLEALFHRMLLLPSPAKRLEPLKAARELLRSPGRLADLLLLSGPIHRHAGDDMAIIRLIMDSIEESSQCNEHGVVLASVECVGALLGSLEALCRGEGLNQEAADLANSRYALLEHADYTGPLTYQSLARLPKPYRDVVANLRYQSDSSDSSGIEGNIRDVEGEESDCSGATEGPEEEIVHSDDSIMDDESFLTNQQLQKLYKLPKSLNLGRTGLDECNTDIERHNARHFVKTLQQILLPNLLTLRSSIQVDEVLQEFASKCCQHNSAQSYEISTIMNADGVYLATYSALLLDLKLIQAGHYDEIKKEVAVPTTEVQFVEEIHGSGVLVYVSATWLCELYQNVLAKSLLLSAGYEPKNRQQPALVNLLTDVGGLSPSQLLTDWQKLQKVQGTPESSPEVEAGIKLSRRVLTCCWSSVVSVLGTPLREKTHLSGTSALSRLVARRARQKYRQKIKDDIITASLEGLHKAASLSNILKLQTRSSSILALLSASSCKNQSTKLLASHALSLDVLLSKGLELGCYSAACWPHVFSACVAVAGIEHSLFSKTGSAQLLMVAQNTQNNIITSTTKSGNQDSLNLNTTDEETCVDVYSFLHSSYASDQSGSNETTIADIVEKSGANNTQGQGILRGVYAAKICCALSQKADELFHAAALRLSLPGLCSFMTELCKASHAQLFTKYEESSSVPKKWWKKELEIQQKPPPTLLLHRIGEVTLKCIKSGRPLIHIMKVWSIVGPHFMQAACHKDRMVSKKAVTCIHDSVTALLNEQAELPHFHFNEALIKPFENLLCLELCDLDVQDQIVACLCEFVEANRTEICSGWRPLFGTLRVANAKNNSAAVSDVFRIFLSTDNTLVFANAALDYILCLLSHIKNADDDGTGDNSLPATPSTLSKKPVGFFEKDVEFPSKLLIGCVDLCFESLKLLQNSSEILSMMYSMPKSPTFNLSHRMIIDTEPQLVDPVVKDSEIVSFSHMHNDHVDYEVLSIQEDFDECAKSGIRLTELDNQSGVLKVYYILLDGLSSAIILSSPKNQPYVIESLFKLLRDVIISPGINFGFCCINHILLPMVQNWLRQNSKSQKTQEVWQNFKHCCGLASELLTLAFKENSDSFYGDLATVKVAARKDSTPTENERLYELAQQVFLMPFQRNCGKCTGRACECEKGIAIDDRSYVFLLYPIDCNLMLNPDMYTIRVPFRNLVVGILAHQMLIQTISSALLQNLKHVTPILNILQINSCSLRGILPKVKAKHVHMLLKCLELSNIKAKDFDMRPGLKFLTQKVGNLCKSANLYTQANTSEVVQIIVLIECCLDGIERYSIEPKNMKEILAKEDDIGDEDRTDVKQESEKDDLGYLEIFLRKLHCKWERLCESYINLTINIPEETIEESEEEKPKDEAAEPQVFKLAEFKQQYETDNISTLSTDSESYLEKEALPNVKDDKIEETAKAESLPSGGDEQSISPTLPQTSKKTGKLDNGYSTDDETNELAAKRYEVAYEKYKVELNSIKYDRNTLLQMRESTISSDNIILSCTRPGDLTKSSSCQLWTEDGRINGNRRIFVGTSPKLNPFMPSTIPPPQPVPPEIQQQRALSICKDAESCKTTKIETMEACLELLSSLPSEKLSPLASLLKQGAVMLIGAQDEKIKTTAELLLQRMNISYVDYDDY